MSGSKMRWLTPLFFPLIIVILIYLFYLYTPVKVIYVLYFTDSLLRPARHKMFASQVSGVNGEVVTRGYLVSTEKTSNSFNLWTNGRIQKFSILPEVMFDCYRVDFVSNGKNINEEDVWIEFGKYNSLTDLRGISSTSRQLVEWLSRRSLWTQVILRNGVYTDPNSLFSTDRLWILGCKSL